MCLFVYLTFTKCPHSNSCSCVSAFPISLISSHPSFQLFLYLQFLPKVVDSTHVQVRSPSFQMLNCITNLESLGSGRENTHLNCFVVTIRLNGSHLLSSNHFFTLPIMTQSQLGRKLLIDIRWNAESIKTVFGHICGLCEAKRKKFAQQFYPFFIQRILF